MLKLVSEKVKENSDVLLHAEYTLTCVIVSIIVL